MQLEHGVLAGKTQLQHLCLNHCGLGKDAAGESQLLSHVQHLQQLTHLSLNASLRAVERTNPPASAYAALTASSKLQHLDISSCTLPAGAWQHLFPTGRQLPSLQSLNIGGVMQPSGAFAAPEGSCLVSCCPRLQSLQMRFLQCSAELLAPLQGLSGLQLLHMSCPDITAICRVLQAVCQLTGLRELGVWGPWRIKDEGSLLQLTQLRQLTMLHIPMGHNGDAIHLSGEIELQLVALAQLIWVLSGGLGNAGAVAFLQPSSSALHTTQYTICQSGPL
jgi:hypothetical protein